VKIGVVGLGSIAQKAYLPLYMKLQDQVDFYFATRSQQVQEEIQEKYDLEHIYNDLDELLAKGIEACFIHTATASHYALVKQCLENNIDVFVDKPLSENFAEVDELLKLAQRKQRILMVGFNRRFAPLVDKLKGLPDKRLLFLQKNAVNDEKETTYEIFDVFLHLVDTAVYLLDEPVCSIFSDICQKDGYLDTASLTLKTENSTASLSMDLKSGANYELYQLTSLSETDFLENLVSLKRYKGEQKITVNFGDWADTLVKRGFEPMVQAFLAAVKTRSTKNLRQKGIRQSHHSCQEMLKQAEKMRQK